MFRIGNYPKWDIRTYNIRWGIDGIDTLIMEDKEMFKANTEQRKAIRTILKKMYRKGYKLADIEAFSFVLDEEAGTVMWVCSITYIIGFGQYQMIELKQEDSDVIEQRIFSFTEELVNRIEKKRPAYEAKLRRKYLDIFGKEKLA